MIPQHVQQILDRWGLKPLEFDQGSTPTVETAAAHIGVSCGQIAKSLLMKGKDDRYRMFVLAGDKAVSSGKVKRFTKVKQSMASAEETLQVTGFSPGAVCPFGVTDIDIFIDISIDAYDVVYPAAGTDASGVPVTYRQLLEITSGAPCDITQ